MPTTEDPARQISYLQQCLSSDKKPLALLLGAGCPMAIPASDEGAVPLIPDIAGITTKVRTALASSEEYGPLLTRINERLEGNGAGKVTVEDMLSHIRGLRAVVGKNDVFGLTAANLDSLDARICNVIHEVVDRTLPRAETPYHRIAAWVEAIRRDKPVEVFTTNYDLLMEQAFEASSVPYFDGFPGASKPFFDLRAMEEDVLPPRWARLWKLHGSINWYQVVTKSVFRGGTSGEAGSKRVIHPSHLKYDESRRMPYLALIDRLRAFLKEPTATLVICGYSFRDQHINEVITQGLQYTQTAIAFALVFGDIAGYPEAAKLAHERANLSILARDGAVIGAQESKWPEKDPAAVSADEGKWVKWAPLDPQNASSNRKAEFSLGDFAVFGEFLNELTGSARSPR